MIKRTYSKRTREATNRPDHESNKRRRVENSSSSSPTRGFAIFSEDDGVLASSPPSSPNQQPTDVTVAKHGYRIVEKLEVWSGRGNSHEQIGTERRHKPQPASPAKENCPMAFTAETKHIRQPVKAMRSKPKPKHLTQMRLDLGQAIHKRCQTCGMEYRPSVKEDKKLHDKFHAKSVEGIIINHKLCQTLRSLEGGVEVNGQDAVLSMPDRGSGGTYAAAQKMFQNVLDAVEVELGGVGIPPEQLWSKTEVPCEKRAELKKDEEHGEKPTSAPTTAKAPSSLAKEDRYKPYIFVRGDKVLGACLAERIFEAYPVLPSSRPTGTGSSGTTKSKQHPTEIIASSKHPTALSTSPTPQPATMGISRIWVSTQARGQGIARHLLDSAAKRFIYHFKIPKAQIAFSQPTQAGSELARRWFGREDGWLVYGG